MCVVKSCLKGAGRSSSRHEYAEYIFHPLESHLNCLLSASDTFQQKCLGRMQQLADEGVLLACATTLSQKAAEQQRLFASHLACVLVRHSCGSHPRHLLGTRAGVSKGLRLNLTPAASGSQPLLLPCLLFCFERDPGIQAFNEASLRRLGFNRAAPLCQPQQKLDNGVFSACVLHIFCQLDAAPRHVLFSRRGEGIILEMATSCKAGSKAACEEAKR